MRNIAVFRAALDGDCGPLRDRVDPQSVVCVAPALSSVFVARRTAAGRPEGVLALAGADGGGAIFRLPLPDALPIVAIDHDDRQYVVTVADGRRIAGTPGQFATDPKLLDAGCNPDYQEQLIEALLAVPTLPEIGAPPHHHPSLTDPALGEVFFDSSIGQFVAVPPHPLPAPPGGGRLTVSFDGAGRDRVGWLLPHVRALLHGWADLQRRTTEFLWDWGVNGDETPADRERFLAEVRPSSLVVYRSGDFELHFEDMGEEYAFDGYWPVVGHRADSTPVRVTVEG